MDFTRLSRLNQKFSKQIQNLELEKFNMQEELDTLKAQAATEASSAHSNLMKVLFQGLNSLLYSAIMVFIIVFSFKHAILFFYN